jgi:ankyrin repeat protein
MAEWGRNETQIMKTKILFQPKPFMKWTVWLCALIGVAQILAAADESIQETLQKGLYEEEANHDLGAAMKAYQSVIGQVYDQRKLAATAVFRLGECNRKLGKTNEAAQLYTRLLGDFAEQTNLVQSCRTLLAGMGKTTAATQDVAGVAGSLIDDEARELIELKSLLKESPDLINAADSNQATRLHRAVEKGHLTLIQFLLDQGVDINAITKRGETPLHLAVLRSQKSLVDFLLSKGADPNMATLDTKQTPLYWAAKWGYKSVAESLLKFNANPNHMCRDSLFGGNSFMEITPLYIAIFNNYQSIAELLLNNGADVHIQANLFPAISGKTQFKLPNMATTALGAAAIHGNTNLAGILLKLGAGIDDSSQEGLPPLMIAIANRRVSFVQWLLEHGANPNVRAKSSQVFDADWLRNQSNPLSVGEDATPLHLAVSVNNVVMAQLLLQNKADVNAKTKNNVTPLMQSMDWSVGPELIQTLLSAGADVNVQDIGGFTALHWAERQSNTSGSRFAEKIPLLLQAKANTELRSKDGNTPLMDAVFCGYSKTIQILADGGADVNATNINGETPLMIVVSRNNIADAQILLAHKADVNALDSQGRTVLDLVQRQQTPPSGTPVRGGIPLATNSNVRLAGVVSKTEMDLGKILRDAGANEDYRRKNRIQASRATKGENGVVKMYSDVFKGKDSDSNNRYTLLEFIGTLYSQSNNGYTFPDMAHVKINRLTSKPGDYQIIDCNVDSLFQSGSSDKDIWLEWGDIVEIPETDHPLAEAWKGLGEKVWRDIDRRLQRTVKISVKGQTTDIVLLPPCSVLSKPFREDVMAPGESTALTVGKQFTLRSFALRDVVFGSKLLRTTSDTGRIKVKRPVGSGEPMQEIACNLSSYEKRSIDNLILRDGDEIEIPDKE